MIPALISAAVAFAVLIISQWVIFLRERTRFMLAKLEDLYFFLLDLGDRHIQRFEPLMAECTRDLGSPTDAAKLHDQISPLTFAQAGVNKKLSYDQAIAADLLDRVSLLVDFYFPQLRPELHDVYKANQQCIDILYKRNDNRPTYEQFRRAVALFDDRKTVMENRILAERPVLTKSFTGKFRAWFED